MQKGIHFDKYDDIPVEVTGQGKPNVGLNRFVRLHIFQELPHLDVFPPYFEIMLHLKRM